MKALRLIAAALALATAGTATPALAQVIGQAPVPTQNSTRFLALAQPLIDNIGGDTVILFYISFDGDLNDPGHQFAVLYLAPGGNRVLTRGEPLRPVVGKLFEAAVEAYRSDPQWRSATLVIDHGKPSLTMRRTSDFEADKSFTARLDAERERVFPDIPLEPYSGN